MRGHPACGDRTALGARVRGGLILKPSRRVVLCGHGSTQTGKTLVFGSLYDVHGLQDRRVMVDMPQGVQCVSPAIFPFLKGSARGWS